MNIEDDVERLDELNEDIIRNSLKTRIIGRDIYYFNSMDSTNDFAKKIAAEGCREGALVVADTQTSGRGRMGRSWSSAYKKGIYMSIVLKPLIEPADMQIITLGASVAVVEGIKRATGIRTGIKWPNDIILNDKKVCGILTEMSSQWKEDKYKINYVVIGIGINVNQDVEDFNEVSLDDAISLKLYGNLMRMHDIRLKRSNIIGNVLLELEKIYFAIINRETDDIINKWKEYSVILGKKIKVISESDEYTATAEDITWDGKLVIRCADGTTREIVSGEVSIRGLNGYMI